MEEDFLEVELVKMKLSDMISPEYNPRKDVRGNPIFYEKLQKSLKKFHYSDLIQINKRNNVIVGGNQRYKVICDMVLDKGKRLDQVEIAVILVDFDEPTELSANVAYNHITGEDDETKLGELLAKLDQTNTELLDYTGIENDEITKLISKLDGNDVKDEKEETEAFEDKQAVFDIKLKIPHQYYEQYKDFVKENTDAPLVEAITKALDENGSNVRR